MESAATLPTKGAILQGWSAVIASAVFLLSPFCFVMGQVGVVPESPEKLIRPPTVAEGAAVKSPGDFWQRPFLTGDWGGWRSDLREKGIDFFFLYQALTLANLSGGKDRGATYQGLWIMSANVNFDKMLPWEGLSFRATSFYPHGASPSGKYVGDRLFVSNIDLYDSVTLWDLWLQQNLWEDKLSLRLGQYLPVEEFASGDFAGIFTGANFTRLGLLSQNFISFPLPAQGARLRLNLSDRFYLQAGVFDGNIDPTYGIDYLNDSGTRINFNEDEGLFSIFEIGYKINQALKGKELPATYKFGGVYHTDDFAHIAQPVQIRGNYAYYAAINQVLWWEKDGQDKMVRAVGLNFRLGAAPEDRNFFSAYADAGLGFPGVIPGRPEDVLASGIGFAKVSGQAPSEFDYEMVWETTYKITVAPWWHIQPTIKFVFHPGASQMLDTAYVIGLRTTLFF